MIREPSARAVGDSSQISGARKSLPIRSPSCPIGAKTRLDQDRTRRISDYTATAQMILCRVVGHIGARRRARHDDRRTARFDLMPVRGGRCARHFLQDAADIHRRFGPIRVLRDLLVILPVRRIEKA